ncbi:putative aminopeptidase-2 [Aphelenchoides bicaudatus]|nr:putative aminopeptidase-2 [Aphelenchoides bicaudatus]
MLRCLTCLIYLAIIGLFILQVLITAAMHLLVKPYLYIIFGEFALLFLGFYYMFASVSVLRLNGYFMRYSLKSYNEHQQILAFNLFYLLFVLCFILASENVKEMVKGRVNANAELSALVFIDFVMTVSLSFALKLEKIEYEDSMNRIMLKSYVMGRPLAEEEAVEIFRYIKKRARFVRIKWDRVGCGSTCSSDLPDEKNPLNVYEQLPQVVKAVGYELQIEPFFPFPGTENDRSDFTFHGTVKIHFHITKPTQHVWLNAENLDIHTVRLYQNETAEVINAFEAIPEKSQFKLSAVNWFSPGQDHTLEIEYDGPLYNTSEGGFYYYTYKVDEQTNKTILATFLIPAFARRMFPGFDDPFFKAWYQIKVVCPKNAAVFGPTPEWDRQYYSETKELVTFKKTPPVSSYLVSLAVGDFGYSEAKTKRNTPVRSITFSEQAKYTKETAKITADCVDAFESLVGYNFPLEKLDSLDTHLNFHVGGGVENWGLIMYTDILMQPWNMLSFTDILAVQTVMCHEVAHQWMGDLVTLKIWGDEFLHQSFANYFQFRLVETLGNEEDAKHVEMGYQFERYYGMQSTLTDDHPISTNVSYFDGTTYSAGCSGVVLESVIIKLVLFLVFRMLEGIVSTEDFYGIVNKFVSKYAFGNAGVDDLIAEVANHFNNQTLCGDLTYNEFLNDFFRNYYYPVVTVDKNGNINQHSANDSKMPDTKWNIPLFVWDDKTQKQQIYWLLKNNTICTLSDKKLTSNTILNHKGLSFSGIHYTADYWEDLLQLDFSRINEHTVFGLLADLSTDTDLETPKGQESILSRLINKILADYNGDLTPQILELMLSVSETDQKLTNNILNVAYPHVSWNPKTLREGSFVGTILPSAVLNDIGDARNKAGDYFAQFMSDCTGLEDIETCNKLNPNIRRSVYCAGALSTDKTTKSFMEAYFKKVLNLYESKFYMKMELIKANAGFSCASKSVN